MAAVQSIRKAGSSEIIARTKLVRAINSIAERIILGSPTFSRVEQLPGRPPVTQPRAYSDRTRTTSSYIYGNMSAMENNSPDRSICITNKHQNDRIHIPSSSILCNRCKCSNNRLALSEGPYLCITTSCLHHENNIQVEVLRDSSTPANHSCMNETGLAPMVATTPSERSSPTSSSFIIKDKQSFGSQSTSTYSHSG